MHIGMKISSIIKEKLYVRKIKSNYGFKKNKILDPIYFAVKYR